MTSSLCNLTLHITAAENLLCARCKCCKLTFIVQEYGFQITRYCRLWWSYFNLHFFRAVIHIIFGLRALLLRKCSTQSPGSYARCHFALNIGNTYVYTYIYTYIHFINPLHSHSNSWWIWNKSFTLSLVVKILNIMSASL